METFIWIIIVIGLSSVTFFSVHAMRIMRRRERAALASGNICNERVGILNKGFRNADAGSLQKDGAGAVSVSAGEYTSFNEETQTAIEKIDEVADKALQEINTTAQLALDELNEKYQEMIFLYNLLDEKIQRAEQRDDSSNLKRERKNRPFAPPLLKNERMKQITSLRDEGLPMSEIAKSLGIGQGEVQLMLELSGRK